MSKFNTSDARGLANGELTSSWEGAMRQALLWACDIIDAAEAALEPALETGTEHVGDHADSQSVEVGLEGRDRARASGALSGVDNIVKVRVDPTALHSESRNQPDPGTTLETKANPVKEGHCPKCGEELGPDGHHLPDPVEPFI